MLHVFCPSYVHLMNISCFGKLELPAETFASMVTTNGYF